MTERQQYLTMSVRDYPNEGGKVLHSGETAGYFGTLGSAVAGIYYGLNGAPEADCVVTQSLSDCLILSNDFSTTTWVPTPVRWPRHRAGSGAWGGWPGWPPTSAGRPSPPTRSTSRGRSR